MQSGEGAGYEARDALVERLRRAKALDLHEVKRGKYFRLVAEVIADEENMSDLLLARGLARPYDGGTQERPFCAGMGGGVRGRMLRLQVRLGLLGGRARLPRVG